MSNRDLSVPALLATAALSGSVLHQAFFKRFEIDKRPVSVASAFVGAYLGLASFLNYYVNVPNSPNRHGVLWALALAFVTLSTFLCSLWLNMLIYRAFFHPLNDFPGPFGAKLSKFWTLNQVVKSKMKWYQVVDKLHAQHGDYIRTGPRELLVFDIAAITPLLGFATVTRKGPFYDSMEDSVNTTRDKVFHKRRRKIWDVAFKQSLSDFGPRVESFTTSLLARIGRNTGKPVVINDIAIHYSYDVMSALAFGKEMGFVEGEADDVASEILRNIEEGIDAIGILLHVPWLMTVLTTFSWAIGPMRKWNEWSMQQAENRKKMTNPKPDLFGHLQENTEDTKKGNMLLYSEARLIIGAGSDTTATALTNIFISLALYPTWFSKLRDEVDEAFSTGTYNCSRSLPILDGIINEALRLYPPVFFPSQRETPPQGVMIGERFIPGNTIISIPPYQIARDERNFVRATDFLPERWFSQPELIINKSAFLTFMTGPHNCAGKNLAMMELRSVVARAVHEFDVHFPRGEKFVSEDYFSRIKDHFVAGAPRQELVFTTRDV